MTAKFSLDKDKIKVLLLEGVHPNTAVSYTHLIIRHLTHLPCWRPPGSGRAQAIKNPAIAAMLIS